MFVRVLTSRTTLPVTLAEAKEHCRVTISTDDNYITGLIHAACDFVEGRTGRAIGTQVLEAFLDCFPETGHIILPRPPFIALDAIDYMNIAGGISTMNLSADGVKVNNRGKYAVIYADSWPTPALEPNAVRLQYRAGHTAAGSPPNPAIYPPELLRRAVLMLVSDMYDMRGRAREARLVETDAIDRMLRPLRLALF